MRLAEVVAVSRDVAASASRLDKIARLADLLRRTPTDEIEIVVSFLSGEPRQGKIGVGWSTVSALRNEPPAPEHRLDLAEVDAAFAELAGASGQGSTATRIELMRRLLRAATPDEQDFLVRLVFGELRQGAVEGVLADAVAKAAGITPDRIRRAAMLAGDLRAVARASLSPAGAPSASAGPSLVTALDIFAVKPFQPLQPMLADSAPDVATSLATLGEALLEHKIDGARIQVHKSGDIVRVFSRNLRDVTAAVPEVVAIARALPARELILDGEAIVLRPDGMPQPFQQTMRRFGRKLDVERLQSELPITPLFFDVLYLDGQPLIDEPLMRRAGILSDQVAVENVVRRLVTSSPDKAAEFVAGSLAAGHEGILAKSLDAPYTAGRRGSAWQKIKQARTLDLVILAAEWGSGRRRGTLSNLHLGAREDRGGFVMLGKTFKGLTDRMLAWQTTRFLEIETGRDARTVYVRPEVVAEVAFNDIQVSPHYPGRLALRFARVKRYRTDKTAAEADTFASVQQIFTQMTGLPPPPTP